jgi:proline iminopeptidase
MAVQDGLGQTRQSTFNADLPGNLAPSAAGASMVGRLTTAQQRRLYAALLQPRALLAYALLQVNPRAAHAFAGDAEVDARFDMVYNLTEPALHCRGALSAPELHGLESYAHQYRQSATRPAHADYRPALAEQHTLAVVIKGSCDYGGTQLSSCSHRAVPYWGWLPCAGLGPGPGACCGAAPAATRSGCDGNNDRQEGR